MNYIYIRRRKMDANKNFPPCGKLNCFSNRGTGKCHILTNTMFVNRGGKEPGENCTFFKTPKEAGLL